MTVLANGCPKSGTHLLMAWLQTMGLEREPGLVEAWHAERKLGYRATSAEDPRVSFDRLSALPDWTFCHAHVHAGHAAELAERFRVITIRRDPRNVLTSFARWRGIEPTAALNDFFGRPFVEVYAGYLRWAGHSLALRFEDFPAGFVDAGTGLYKGAARDNNTRTGAPSDWRETWSDEMHAAWRDAGGWFLVRDAGYA